MLPPHLFNCFAKLKPMWKLSAIPFMMNSTIFCQGETPNWSTPRGWTPLSLVVGLHKVLCSYLASAAVQGIHRRIHLQEIRK